MHQLGIEFQIELVQNLIDWIRVVDIDSLRLKDRYFDRCFALRTELKQKKKVVDSRNAAKKDAKDV